MLVKALEIASVEQARQIHEQLASKDFDPDTKVKKMMDLYDQLKVKAISESIANEYINTAFSLLEKLDSTKERKAQLAGFANSLIGRDS
jgi:geranylgeranyl diphosphate synthase type II